MSSVLEWMNEWIYETGSVACVGGKKWSTHVIDFTMKFLASRWSRKILEENGTKVFSLPSLSLNMRNEQKIIGAVRYGKDTQFYNDIGQIFKLVLSVCMYTYRNFLLWLGRRQEALAVSMIGGPIWGKELRGVNVGGAGCVYGRWAHMRHNASKVDRIMTSNKRVVIPFS